MLQSQHELPPILKRVVETKLDVAGALELVKKLRFGNNPLGLTAENSLLLEFQGLEAESKYRLLVTFLPLDLPDLTVQQKLARCRDVLWFNLALCWNPVSLPSLQYDALKRVGIHVIAVEVPQRIGSPFQPIPDFIHVPHLAYEQMLEVNLLANELVKRLLKKFHLVLSELAAESYDSYGTFATREVMKFEDEVLRDALKDFVGPQHMAGLAIDVGCGNGRHTRVLAHRFAEVIAFDISPRMLDAARQIDHRQLPQGSGAISYSETDIEYEEFPGEADFVGRADFVCASFGMPSFVEDTVAFLRRIYRWLRPDGKALLTFYNADSAALRFSTPWRDRALSAAIDPARNSLEVEIRDGVRFSIYCKPLDSRISDMIRATFTIERRMSFPHVLSMLPPAFFGSDDRPQQAARDLLAHLDRTVATAKMEHGHYVFMVVRKERTPKEGYLRALQALDIDNIEYNVIEHESVVSTRDVEKYVAPGSGTFVKTVIFKDQQSGRFIVAIVSAQHRVSRERLAAAAGTDHRLLILAPPAEVEKEFGFPIGGVAPLGYDPHTGVFLDTHLANTEAENFYCGVGDNERTLRVSRESFAKIMASTRVVPLIDT